jgi:hypothetical protein
MRKPVRQELTKENMRDRLRQLADGPPPKDLSMGADCYSMAMPPNRAEYVCPVCGDKTLYQSSFSSGLLGTRLPSTVEWTIPYLRRQTVKVEGVDVELIESEFCRTCTPAGKKPELGLEVLYATGYAHRTHPITDEDVTLLVEFTTGKDAHDLGQQGEKPLKNYVNRIQELLGVRFGDGQ